MDLEKEKVVKFNVQYITTTGNILIMTFRYLLQMIENDSHPSFLDICAGVRVTSTSNTDLGISLLFY